MLSSGSRTTQCSVKKATAAELSKQHEVMGLSHLISSQVMHLCVPDRNTSERVGTRQQIIVFRQWVDEEWDGEYQQQNMLQSWKKMSCWNYICNARVTWSTSGQATGTPTRCAWSQLDMYIRERPLREGDVASDCNPKYIVSLFITVTELFQKRHRATTCNSVQCWWHWCGCSRRGWSAFVQL